MYDFISNELFSYFRNAPFQSVAFIFSLLQFNRKRLKQQGYHHTKEKPYCLVALKTPL